jgi:sulfonate transport system substrate-binding protein
MDMGLKRSSSRWLGAVLAFSVVGSINSRARAQEGVVKAKPVAPQVSGTTRVLKLGLSAVTAVAAQKGWLQEELGKVNATFSLVDTSSFGTSGTTAALYDRGDLHIAQSMMNGALQNRAQGLDNIFIWQSVNVKPERAVTLVLKDGNLYKPEDLKGKTLASSLTSCPYYAGIESLRAKGVTVDNEWFKGDMRYVNITNQASSTSALLAGRFDVAAWHPQSAAALYVQGLVREITQAVPGGIYTDGAGRSAYSTTKKYARDNPDIVKAFLVAWDRTVRWLYANHGANLNEAATITSRALRQTKSVALFNLKGNQQTAYEYGVTDYWDAVNAIKRFWKYQIEYKDPFFTKHQISDKEIEALVDKRFFAGGEYFVDVSEKGNLALNK